MMTKTTVDFSNYVPGLKGRAQRELDRKALGDALTDAGFDCRLVAVGGVPSVVVEYDMKMAASVGAVLTRWESTRATFADV